MPELLAGGTDLLVQFRAGMQQPSAFIDVKRIPELVGITSTRRGLRLGAATAAAAICEHAGAQRLCARAWSKRSHLIGSTQIQGRGTVGGNLCNASPAADTTCALIVNRARCVIAGPEGERIVPVEEFCTGPGRTVLGPGEFLVAFRIPRPAPRTADAYLRLIPRTEMDIAVAGAARQRHARRDRRLHGGARRDRRGRADRAARRRRGRRRSIGSRLDDDALARAAAAASAAASPIDDKRGTVGYRRTVVGVLTRRAAAIAGPRAARRRRLNRGEDCTSQTTVNGEPAEFLCEPAETLLDALRDRLGLTGTKEGCATGDCGACSVLIDGRLVPSCLVLAAEAQGRRSRRSKGVAQRRRAAPAAAEVPRARGAAVRHLHAGLHRRGQGAARRESRSDGAGDRATGWPGNLCRCTGYDKIVRAVLDAAAR